MDKRMSNYSNKPNMCRVDFFKPSGKWYTTEEFEFLWYTDKFITDAFRESLLKAFPNRYTGMTAVCLHPHHEHEHPLMLPEWDTP